jgi:hypothetical protein
MGAPNDAEMKALQGEIDHFARVLGLTGEITAQPATLAAVSLVNWRTKRFKRPNRANAERWYGLGRLSTLLEKYEKFLAFSAKALADEITQAREQFHKNAAEAAKLHEDNRQFFRRKRPAAKRKQQRQSAAA